jgi:hypothetical protein
MPYIFGNIQFFVCWENHFCLIPKPSSPPRLVVHAMRDMQDVFPEHLMSWAAESITQLKVLISQCLLSRPPEFTLLVREKVIRASRLCFLISPSNQSGIGLWQLSLTRPIPKLTVSVVIKYTASIVVRIHYKVILSQFPGTTRSGHLMTVQSDI